MHAIRSNVLDLLASLLIWKSGQTSPLSRAYSHFWNVETFGVRQPQQKVL